MPIKEPVAEKSAAIATPPARQRLAFLDALRGAAALWVVLFHFGEGGQLSVLLAWLPQWLSAAIFTSGFSGVPVFFVLSGFLLGGMGPGASGAD